MAFEKRHNPFIRRFVRAKKGAVAVEFAFVALPFIALLMALFELAMVFIVNLTLESATSEAARQIRTGEFQTSAGNSKADFENLVCSNMMWLRPTCAGRMSVDVETFAIDDFQGLANNGTPDTETCFAPGNPGDVVMVRTFFEWPLFTPILNHSLVNMGDKKRLMNSVVSFRNEPLNNNDPTGAQCT
jgi:Flp pilus assembly protein TadG